jgi:hypothetical protein
MASYAEFPAAVDGKGKLLLRMIESRAMTVLADDIGMGRLAEVSELFPVTILTVGNGPVLYPECFPVCLVPFPVPAVHIAPFPDTEIPRHQEELSRQQQQDDTEHNKERSPGITLHLNLPSPGKRPATIPYKADLQTPYSLITYFADVFKFISFAVIYNRCCRIISPLHGTTDSPAIRANRVLCRGSPSGGGKVYGYHDCLKRG